MRFRPFAPAAAAFLVAATATLSSQQPVDLGVVDRIKDEASARSQVMDTLQNLTDVHGPRLTWSAEYDDAAKWAMERLTSYGLSNVHLETWQPSGRRWSLESSSAEMLTPHYARLAAAPLAWSGSTNGPVTGEPVLTPLDLDFVAGLKKLSESFEQYRRQWTGKLRGRIVMLTPAKPLAHRDKPLFRRYTDAELAEMTKAPEPMAIDRITSLENLDWPDDPQAVFQMFMAMPERLVDQLIERYDALAGERAAFFVKEGVAGLLFADNRAREGLLAAEAAGSFHAKDALAPPSFVVSAEHYNRIARLIGAGQKITIRLELKESASDADVPGSNIVSEIPGGARRDEIVMVGAHFDSWHTGTGATDNGAGSAVMMEVMRILKTLDLKLDRTVRIALWGGEEQGLFGSRAYVSGHFADPDTMALKPEHAKLSAYFNLDNGGGKIRGVYLQGHEAMRPIFEQWLAPFRNMGVTTVTIQNTGGTDHLSFARVGLPGFQFIQDPLDYQSITHHTSADTLDHIVPADLMQAAAVIASVVYDAANRPDMLPRRPLPKGTPATAAAKRP